MMADSAAVRPCEYKVGRILGEGTYAKVKEALHIKTGQMYACKIFNKKLMQGREKTMVLNEISILQQVSKGHKNLIALQDYFESTSNLYLIMDLCEGGELFYRICNKGYFDEHDAAVIIRTICDAVAYLHEKGIVHRDLKPENLLFRSQDPNSDLLIADFGLSRCLESDTFPLLSTTCGTPGFMSPEILQCKAYGKPVDMWAIGVITYFILSGYTPFDRNSTVDEIEAIIKADYTFEPKNYWLHVSETAKDFILNLLKLDPSERMTARQALAHPWLLVTSDSSTTTKNSNLLPQIKVHSVKASDKLRKAVRTMQAVSYFAKIAGYDPTNIPAIPQPVDEVLPND